MRKSSLEGGPPFGAGVVDLLAEALGDAARTLPTPDTRGLPSAGLVLATASASCGTFSLILAFFGRVSPPEISAATLPLSLPAPPSRGRFLLELADAATCARFPGAIFSVTSPILGGCPRALGVEEMNARDGDGVGRLVLVRAGFATGPGAFLRGFFRPVPVSVPDSEA